MEVCLQIHHLDDKEADSILAILSEKSLSDGWAIERPTDSTNSILIRDLKAKDFSSVSDERNIRLERARELLLGLDPKQISNIRSFDLNVTLKIITNEFTLPIKSSLLKECGRLGIDIYVFNTNR